MHLWNWLANETHQYANITDISADVADSSTDINTSITSVSLMDFTDVLMLKIWLILANTDTDVNIGASLLLNTNSSINTCWELDSNRED